VRELKQQQQQQREDRSSCALALARIKRMRASVYENHAPLGKRLIEKSERWMNLEENARVRDCYVIAHTRELTQADADNRALICERVVGNERAKGAYKVRYYPAYGSEKCLG